ncbi:MAG: hypothetical protein M3P04_13020 [Actinomycetota bacterium]|nr:hypothetical protein [Actinomycetota bacterium]
MTSLKYARVEREQRYLLDALPDLAGARVLRITDRYLDGTRMRLRLVEEDGRPPVHKLGQKIRLDRVSTNAHTTMYLSPEEHAGLAYLPGHVLRKTRHLLDGWAFDVHESGLLLAESESATKPWFSVVRDVTDEEAFSGGCLASLG